jgi:hypothetical protein
MPPLRRRRSTKKVPAIVYFRQQKNEKDRKQSCVYAECILGGTVVGPVWGHTDQAVRKAVSDLTRSCDCPAKFHQPREYVGRRNRKTT